MSWMKARTRWKHDEKGRWVDVGDPVAVNPQFVSMAAQAAPGVVKLAVGEFEVYVEGDLDAVLEALTGMWIVRSYPGAAPTEKGKGK